MALDGGGYKDARRNDNMLTTSIDSSGIRLQKVPNSEGTGCGNCGREKVLKYREGERDLNEKCLIWHFSLRVGKPKIKFISAHCELRDEAPDYVRLLGMFHPVCKAQIDANLLIWNYHQSQKVKHPSRN